MPAQKSLVNFGPIRAEQVLAASRLQEVVQAGYVRRPKGTSFCSADGDDIAADVYLRRRHCSAKYSCRFAQRAGLTR